MKYTSVILMTFILFWGCKKFSDFKEDTKEDSYIRGRLFLYDALTANANGTPLANKTVEIFYNSSKDSINYLFSAVTDSLGYFVFTNLNKDSSYRLLYEEKTDSIYHIAERTSIQPPQDTISLNAVLNTNKESGLVFTISDSMGAPVKGATICVYSSSSFFQPGSCNNSNYSLTTDAYGQAYIFSVPSIQYYSTAYISVNGSTYLANDITTVGNTISYRYLNLLKAKQTGYNILVIDSLGSPVPGTQLCFFTSEVLFNTNNCSGSNFQDSSDVVGIAKGSSAAGTYYVIANKQVDSSLLFVATDTIYVTKDQITSDTVRLRKK